MEPQLEAKRRSNGKKKTNPEKNKKRNFHREKGSIQ